MTAVAQECCSKQGQLTIQRWLSDAKRTGRKDVCAGKRPHARYTWSTAVMVTFDQPGHGGPPMHASTRDISVSGLSFECRRQFSPNTIVRIKAAAWGGSVVGVVRFCRRSVGAFRVGVEFLPDEEARSDVYHAA
ncbi:MAG: PilZ domain-containing protein [Phycisphaerae bacterium]